MKISQVIGREIINSKGIPTVEVKIFLENGISAVSSCPTGTSVGTYEAKELRDIDQSRFGGLGVAKAVNNVNTLIAPKIKGMDSTKQHEIDRVMIELDGTDNKSNLGTNSILPVSMAVAKTASISLNIPLYQYLRQYTGLVSQPLKIPTPLFNLINGGKHAGDTLNFQEFLVIPAISVKFSAGLSMAVNIYHALGEILKDKGDSTLIGDEGGFSPTLATNRDALILLNEAIGAVGLRMNYDVFLGIDAAANNFYQDNVYTIKDKMQEMSAKDLITVYEGLNAEYNLLYLEDPLAEDDWEGWEDLNKVTSDHTIIVGDDLTTTNYQRLQMAISKNAIGGIIIKPNQIGTVIEAIAVVESARQAGLKIIASHRSGETNDDLIADFAVGVGADYAKLGAPARGERVAKYNRLLEIESQITPSG